MSKLSDKIDKLIDRINKFTEEQETNKLTLSAYRAEVTRLQDELETVKHKFNEHTQTPPLTSMPYSGIEGYCPHLGATVRTCLDCGCVVTGGTTRCVRCVSDYASLHDEDTGG